MTTFLITDINKYIGLSDDIKPVLKNSDVGSTFIESDTKDKYIWSGQGWVLFQPAIKEMTSNNICVILTKILKEQQKINCYLSLMNDVSLQDKDIFR